MINRYSICNVNLLLNNIKIFFLYMYNYFISKKKDFFLQLFVKLEMNKS
jgi:hypothetical protein